MPFDTIERSTKRLKAEDLSATANINEWYMQPSIFDMYNNNNNNMNTIPTNEITFNHTIPSAKAININNNNNNMFVSHNLDKLNIANQHYASTPALPIRIPVDTPISTHDINSNMNIMTDYMESSSSLDEHISPQSNHFWQDDNISTEENNSQSPFTHRPSTCSTLSSPPKLLLDSLNAIDAQNQTTSLLTENPLFKDILSKIRFSYSDVGINLEAKVSNASDLRTLIDAFSQMCCSSTNDIKKEICNQHNAKQNNKMPVYRNKSNQTKPVNFFDSTCTLGQISNPHSSLESSEKQIADACIEIYFTCWVRYKPIFKKDEFLKWYHSQEYPLDTLIVNAICSYVFRHMVIHHPEQKKKLLNQFLNDEAKLLEQEEYFFNRARECLAQSFDTPDRYTIIALLFMSVRADPSKCYHYIGMAISAMHELNIYPRMINEDADDYEKEMDTRLWWFVWACEFSIRSAGALKNTPQPKQLGQQVDFPQIFEQDIDDGEISVITYAHCLKLWKIQSDIVTALYEQDNFEMTYEQLIEYDRRLLNFHENLPKYLVFDSGFEYGCEDLFVACLRVNIEYNATRIILHKLFMPEMNDIRPTQASLESLNICLSTALTQLSAIKTCNMGDIGRCAFDRDELWRAAEVISVATDIYHTCVSPPDQIKILKGIKLDTFKSGLAKSYQILQNTREYRLTYKNWLQVANWIQVEISRHQLVRSSNDIVIKNQALLLEYQESLKENKPDYFLAHLKPNAVLTNLKRQKPEIIQPPIKKPTAKSASSKQQKQQQQKTIKKPSAFQNQFSVECTNINNSPTMSSFSFQQVKKPSFSAAPPFVQFNAYSPHEPESTGKSPARFRYFNPRKMNKILFIDEHPII